MIGTGTYKTPSASVVLPHYIFGAVSFLILSILAIFSLDAFAGHYFHPKLLALTHVAVLGWGTMIIFGALYQLLPVIMETSLYSEKLAIVTFVFFALGIICITYSFWNFYVGIHLQVASCLLFIAFLLFTINIFKTATSSKKWSIASDFIVTSTFWLLITGIIGMLMAFNFRYVFLPKSHLLFLKIHAHIGIVGWFVLLIMGVASKLLPMFLLSPEQNDKKLNLAFYLVNFGLLLFSMDMYLFEGSRFLPLIAIIIITGLLSFLFFIFESYRKRLRQSLDIGLKHSLLAFTMIFLPALIGIAINFKSLGDQNFSQQVYLVYGISIFLGVITALILGQTFKTLPFIVWIYKYRSQAGKINTPLPKDLYSDMLAKMQHKIYICSMATLLTGVLFIYGPLIKTGIALLFVTAVIYNLNVFKILFISATKK